MHVYTDRCPYIAMPRSLPLHDDSMARSLLCDDAWHVLLCDDAWHVLLCDDAMARAAL